MTDLLLVTAVLLSRQASTHNTAEISKAPIHPLNLSTSALFPVENITSWNGTDVVMTGNENYSSNPESELTIDGSPSEDTLEEAFTRAEKAVQKYVIFTIHVVSFFGCILMIIVLQRGALKSSSTVYIRGIAMSSILSRCCTSYIPPVSTTVFPKDWRFGTSSAMYSLTVMFSFTSAWHPTSGLFWLLP